MYNVYKKIVDGRIVDVTIASNAPAGYQFHVRVNTYNYALAAGDTLMTEQLHKDTIDERIAFARKMQNAAPRLF